VLTIAYERQAHQSRLRNEITRSKAEQSEYLRNVELARVLDKRRAKKAAADNTGNTPGAREGANGEAPGKSVGDGGKTGDKRKADEGLGGEKAKRNYRQRQAVDKDGMREKGMESVLGSVFG
jgi:ESF2/ABP1 family protein